jgi:hypothetical protein
LKALRSIPDILSLVTLMFLTGLVAVRLVDFSEPPFEDAAMLMRYADHLAHGQGIVWNIGEPPLDGTTDFLFLVVWNHGTPITTMYALISQSTLRL